MYQGINCKPIDEHESNHVDFCIHVVEKPIEAILLCKFSAAVKTGEDSKELNRQQALTATSTE